MITLATVLLFGVTKLTPGLDQAGLVALGLPTAHANSFQSLIEKPLARTWPESGSTAKIKFSVSKSNPAIEGLFGGSKEAAKGAIDLLAGLDQEFQKQGFSDDLSWYVTFLLADALQGAGQASFEGHESNVRGQIAAMISKSWDAAPTKERQEAAESVRGLLALQIISSASEDKEARKKLSQAMLTNLVGSDAKLTLKNKFLSRTVEAAPVSATSLTPNLIQGEATFKEEAGFVRKDFGGRPGLTKNYPDYPNETTINFVLDRISNRSYTNFLAAWKASIPGPEWTGMPLMLPIRRYVGVNGARALLGYGQIKLADGGFQYMMLCNIENGAGSQPFIGFFRRGGDVNQIFREIDEVLATFTVPSAKKLPLTTVSEIVGTWSTRGASQMGYFNSSGNMVGATMIDRNVTYTFKRDGTFTYNYQGVTGVIGAAKADEDKQSGKYEISGEVLIIKPSNKPVRRLTLRGVVTDTGKKVLLLGKHGTTLDEELSYIEKYIPAEKN